MKKIFIAGHNGMVGSSINRILKKKYKIIVIEKKKLDLRDFLATDHFIKKKNPDIVIICAATVGGILKNNTYPAKFYYDNVSIQNNLISSSLKHGVKNLIFLGSSCIYPKNAKQPLKEKYLLDGKLEPTNEAYALAKICGIKYIEYINRQYQKNYISLMPSNLYGYNDNFDIMSGHFLPGLINKIYNAKFKNKKTVEIFGNGKPKREIMFVDDLARAVELILKLLIQKNKKLLKILKRQSFINVGTGIDYTIINYANMIKKEIGYKGKFIFNNKYPNGTMRKLLDISIIKSLGWKPSYTIQDGISKTINWYNENVFKK